MQIIVATFSYHLVTQVKNKPQQQMLVNCANDIRDAKYCNISNCTPLCPLQCSPKCTKDVIYLFTLLYPFTIFITTILLPICVIFVSPFTQFIMTRKSYFYLYVLLCHQPAFDYGYSISINLFLCEYHTCKKKRKATFYHDLLLKSLSLVWFNEHYKVT